MSSDILVSVIVPVYNVEKYIAETIQSVLSQTHHRLELILIDDCSPDNSMEIVKGFDDARIILCYNTTNMGPGAARNTGIRASSGKYIAILDSDDIATPDRLSKQVEYLENNHDIGICGTGYKYFGTKTKTPKQSFISSDELKASFAFEPGFHISTIMIRRDVIISNNLFYWEVENWRCEDFEYCLRAIECTAIAVIPDCLYLYRQHDSQQTINDLGFKTKTAILSANYTNEHLGNILNKSELELYIDMLAERNIPSSKKYYDIITSICSNIHIANRENNFFRKDVFNRKLSLRWYRGIKPSVKNGAVKLKELLNTELFKDLPLNKKIGLILKLFIH